MRDILKFKSFISTNITFEAPAPFEIEKAVKCLMSALTNEPGLKKTPTGVPDNATPNVPRYLFSYHGTNLLLSKTSLTFSIEYEGNAQRSYEICDQLIRKRTQKIFDALVPDVLKSFEFAGVVNAVNYSYTGTARTNAAEDIAKQFFKINTGQLQLEDTEFRIGCRYEEKYFINIACANYETREKTVEIPKQVENESRRFVAIGVYDGTVKDIGIAVIVDVNTKLYKKLHETPLQIEKSEYGKLLDLVRQVIEQRVDKFLAEGAL